MTVINHPSLTCGDRVKAYFIEVYMYPTIITFIIHNMSVIILKLKYIVLNSICSNARPTRTTKLHSATFED